MRTPTGLPPRALVLGLLALTALRLVVAARAGLVDDEAYYRLWSLDLRFGYLDHAPMVAWLIRAGRTLVGDTALGLRLFAPVGVLLGSLLLWRMVALVEGRDTATRAALWFNAMILVGAGSVLMTPDTPAVFFWGATLWALTELAVSRDPAWWPVVGVMAGLDLASKYSAFFLGLGILLWLVSTRASRRWFAAWQTWVGGLVALLLFAPVVHWNATHDWASFAKQFGRTAVKEWRFDTPFELVGVQILLVGLPMVPFVALGIGRAWRGWRDGNAAAALPLATSLPFVAYLLHHSLHGRIEGNWPAPLYPALAWMAASVVVPSGAAARGLLSKLAAAVAPFGFALTALLYLHVCTSLLILPQTMDPTAQMRGWETFARDLEAKRVELGLDWIGAENYTLEGQLARHLGWARVVPFDEPERWLHLPPATATVAAGPGLLVVRSDRDGAAAIAPRFREATEVGHLDRAVDGIVIRRYDLYRLARPVGP